jgi:hypothetical protein
MRLCQQRVECRRWSAGGAVIAPGGRRATRLVLHAAGEGRLRRRSCGPADAGTKVGSRPSLTFTGRIRPAAPSLDQSASWYGPRSPHAIRVGGLVQLQHIAVMRAGPRTRVLRACSALRSNRNDVLARSRRRSRRRGRHRPATRRWWRGQVVDEPVHAAGGIERVCPAGLGGGVPDGAACW